MESESGEKKLEIIITKLLVIIFLGVILAIGYKAFKTTFVNIFELIVNPFLDKPLPSMNIFKFIWYMFFISVCGVFTSGFIAIGIISSRDLDEFRENKSTGAVRKVQNVISDYYLPRGLKFFWLFGLFYVFLVLILGQKLSFFEGIYIWGISYFLLVTIYICINTIIDSFIVKVKNGSI
ncbi:MAG TPA: hypothetical protein PLE26_00460 [Candidatus Paceibacterota bacterium]|nr:hypothetical protein [Candidatus Paceibacterota bacterium]HQB57011.1 hypothetical protein [Candidatus Paceibacterota bacterium]